MAGRGDTGQGYVNEIVDLANAGDTSGFTKADWKIIADNAGYTTPRAAAAAAAAAPVAPAVDPAPYIPELYNYENDPETKRLRESIAAEKAMADKVEGDRQRNAIAQAKELADTYGLTSLYNKMVDYIKQGYNSDAIMSLIKTTTEYKQRFPAMEALAKKNRAITEAQYIEYERRAAELERQFGLPSNMLQSNVTQLLTNEVGMDELNERVVLASGASVTAPQEFKDSLKNYYGIDSGGLAAYFLDPTIATPLLQKKYATALIGSEALKQNVNLGLDIASTLENMGVTQDEATQGFRRVRQDETLTRGRGDTVRSEDLIKGTFGQADAAKDIERARGGRKAQFEGGGGFSADTRGVKGLGSSATT